MTALDVASEKGHDRIVQVLVLTQGGKYAMAYTRDNGDIITVNKQVSYIVY